MDFDHLHSKFKSISRLVSNGMSSALEAEIAKCEVVCANCHRIRTHNRMTAGVDGAVAQQVERHSSKVAVAGSIPACLSGFNFDASVVYLAKAPPS
jgi:hypothetical protein